MEDRIGAASLSVPANGSTQSRPVSADSRGDRAARGWIVEPWFDLLLFSNVYWPLLPLSWFTSKTETVVDFWQIYFLTLPHRWITLVLVGLDPDRREGRGALLAVIALAAAAFVFGLKLVTGAFTCLAVIDYCWNAWHFAAQHAGILRIYARKVGGGSEFLERHGTRLFVTYTVLRTAGWTTGFLESDPTSRSFLRLLDTVMLAFPVALVLVNLAGWRRDRAGKMLYALSFMGLYSGLLVSLMEGWSAGVVALTTASGMFHAAEYLAIVSYYADRRRVVGAAGAFRALAAAWLPFLVAYIAVLGSLGVWLEARAHSFREVWQGLNVWAAFVHYSFDGMIWKLRRPETATTLGAGRGPT